MSRRWVGFFFASLSFGMVAVTGAATAQEMLGVNGGANSNNGALYGPIINRVNGTNRNGTPRQQNPGASMTNGAGNSYMTPGVTGPINPVSPGPGTIPPKVILHGNVQPGGAP
jgi:hypothetical protein